MEQVTKYDIAILKWFQGVEDEEISLRYGKPQQKASALIQKINSSN